MRLADRRLDLVAPLQEGLDQQELRLGQAAPGPRDAGGRLRHRHHRNGQRLLVHHDGAGGQIAEPLVARRDQHRHDADGVDARHLIDHPQQVAEDGFVDPGRAPGDAQHAEADQPLARRLPVPERLEAGEVPVEQQERGDDDDGEEPWAAGLWPQQRPCAGHRREHRQPDRHLQQHVDRQRQEAAADAGQRELQRDLLRCLDAKLIGCRHRLSPCTGCRNGKRTGRGSRRWSRRAGAATSARSRPATSVSWRIVPPDRGRPRHGA